MRLKRRLARVVAVTCAGTLSLSTVIFAGGTAPLASAAPPTPISPIQHLVVIFQENESFDHYFGTYPVASNPTGEDEFTPASSAVNSTAANTTINNLVTASLLSNNPNGANPQRLDPGPNSSGVYNGSLDANGSNPGIDQVLTCSMNHNYQPEQDAFDGGKMDAFPGNVGSTSSPPEPGETDIPSSGPNAGGVINGGTGSTAGKCNPNLDLDYYDGNTVTGYWNYSQHYAMSDNSFGTTFGPSTPGAINVISGDTGNVNEVNNAAVTTAVGTTSQNSGLVPDGDGLYSDVNDSDPFYDDCSSTSANFGINNVGTNGPTTSNIGDELSEAGLSWGFFEGGFTPTTAATGATQTAYSGGPAGQTGKAVCGATHNIGAALGGTGSSGAQPYGTKADYIQHHQPFQYYATTANPRHYLPTSLAAVGTDTQTFTGGCYGCGTPEFNTANHQYDISYFDQIVSGIAHGTLLSTALPAVSYLKAPAYEDEHPGNSDPIDGQKFVTQEINALMQTPDWSNTAVVVAYDDSDGWYDHVFSGNSSDKYNTSPTGVSLNQSSANGSVTAGAPGDAENPAVCGGTAITGTALGTSIVIGSSNDTVTYTVGGGPTQTATIAASTYTPTTLASAIQTASGGAIIAQADSGKHLNLQDNGLKILAITGGTALSSIGISGGSTSTPANPVLTNSSGQAENGRCGFGPRLPLIVISPYSKADFIDHTVSDQASVPNFIEYNWGLAPIAGSADHVLTNPAATCPTPNLPVGCFDLGNMFDFTPGATDVAGPSPYYLDSATFLPTSIPTPELPESRFPVLMPILGAVTLVGAGLLVGRRRLRHRTA